MKDVNPILIHALVLGIMGILVWIAYEWPFENNLDDDDENHFE